MEIESDQGANEKIQIEEQWHEIMQLHFHESIDV